MLFRSGFHLMVFSVSSSIRLILFKLPLHRLAKPALKGLGLVCGGSLCLFQSVHAQNIDYLEASFTLEYNNKITESENRLKIQHSQNQYDITFEFDHWLLSANQKARFEMNQCDVRPQSYVATNKLPFKDATSETLLFDWNDKKANYNGRGEQKTFNLETALYDPMSFFFMARCDLIAGKKQFTHALIHKGNKKDHTYKVVGTEIVETGQGNVEALIVERVRDSNKRQTRFYVAPSLDYLLVKIQHQEGWLLTIAATLKSMDYKLVNTLK